MRATPPRPCFSSSPVPDRTVMDMMGWSTPTMKKRYMHVTDEIRDVADQLNAHFWRSN